MAKIMQMADFSKNFYPWVKDFQRATEEGTFIAELLVAHWVTHRLIHSYWVLKNGKKLDLILFPEDKWLGIEDIKIGEKVLLTLVKTSSGSVYLRKIEVNNNGS